MQPEQLPLFPVLGKCRADADEHAEVRAAATQVLPELARPLRAPVAGTLGLPEQHACELSAARHYPLDHVPATGTLAHLLDHVEWKCRLEVFLQRQFQHLALQLLRALGALALRLGELPVHVRDPFLQLGLFELSPLALLGADTGLKVCATGVEPARDLDLKLPGPVLQCLLLPEELQFARAHRSHLTVLITELALVAGTLAGHETFGLLTRGIGNAALDALFPRHEVRFATVKVIDLLLSRSDFRAQRFKLARLRLLRQCLYFFQRGRVLFALLRKQAPQFLVLAA